MQRLMPDLIALLLLEHLPVFHTAHEQQKKLKDKVTECPMMKYELAINSHGFVIFFFKSIVNPTGFVQVHQARPDMGISQYRPILSQLCVKCDISSLVSKSVLCSLRCLTLSDTDCQKALHIIEVHESNILVHVCKMLSVINLVEHKLAKLPVTGNI